MRRLFSLIFVALLSASAFSLENYPTLGSVPNKALSGQPHLNICFYLENELLHDTEIGTAFLNLAATLAEAQHSITILHNQPLGSNDQLLLSSYRKNNINFQLLPRSDIQATYTPDHIYEAYQIYEYLKQQSFDYVHFPDWKGSAYYTVLAKHQGLAFENTVFVISLFTPYIQAKISNMERVVDTVPLEIDFMQRKSAELADVVVSPTQYLVDNLISQGWRLQSNPSQRIFIQAPVIATSRVPIRTTLSTQFPTEIVFYGDLIPSEGLVVFCDALDELAASSALPTDFKVTFLGKQGSVQGVESVDYIALRGKKWSFPHFVTSNKDRYESLRYALSSSRLSVLPRSELAGGFTLLRVEELLEAKIPFLTSDVGGVSEWIAESSREKVLFPPAQRSKLAKKILDAIQNGVLPAESKVLSADKNARQWAAWHVNFQMPTVKAEEKSLPLATVVIVHHDRPGYLKQAVSSVERQDYPNLEVIIVDDASKTPEALAELDEIEKQAHPTQKWSVLRLKENVYLGEARNLGVQAANGKYVIFLDDDNVATPKEVSVFVSVAERTGADVLTSVEDYFTGSVAPVFGLNAAHPVPLYRRVPLGGDLATGFYWNCYGDANSFIRRSTFLKMGGFTSDYALGYEDYEFFANAILKGLKLEVVPEPLFWYRLNPGSMSTVTPLYQNRMRSLRPYLHNLPPELNNLFLYAHTLKYRGADEVPREHTVQVKQVQCPTNATNCAECVSTNGCGWCEMTYECLPGTAVNSTSGTFCNGTQWQFGQGNCLQNCSKYTSCEKCSVLTGDCGWCENEEGIPKCQLGAGDSPFYMGSLCYHNSTHKAQSRDWFINSDCPKEKYVSVAIIAGSISAGVLVLIFAVAGLIFWMKIRQPQRGGYQSINRS